ncbi:hypothetical protein [Microbacterium indicum]|uniref:hypothetical protein n=1 Tax=Microbacterium indicum TaxID=358100 RepID=UPI00041459EB|nr:hypothetical protein [Microbacterium indicum]
MNLIDTFQNLVAQVPELVQPLIVALAAAIPYIEGEGAVAIGIIGGIHPIVAAVAAIAGNLICVVAVVLVTTGAREAVVARRRASAVGDAPAQESSPRREKLQRALVRYGVPGVSLLGPIIVPTQLTAAFLAGSGVSRGRILAWQGTAIVLWTTLLTLVATGIVNVVA